MLKYFTLLLAITAGHLGISQATLFTDDFESGGAAWTATDDLLPNYWIVDNCSGNGTTAPGTEAMYITPGGVMSGCGPTGDVQHAYVNAGVGTLMATNYTTVDATCATALQVSFDYRIEGVSTEDFAELVYSTDGGTTWVAVGSEFAISAAWTTTTIGLPAALDGTSFELGFRFTYNDLTLFGLPIAVDNVMVTGTDTTPPVMVCPTSIDQGVTTNCEAFADDYGKAIILLSDNCTDSVDIVVTQDIPETTLFASGPGGFETITVTATDEAGNSTQCVITVNIIDDMSPTPTCPADTNVYVDANCDGLIEDYTGDVTVTDNCTSQANMIISQSPLPGTVINGSIIATPVTITVTDESGNTETCVFVARTIDTMVATIMCPPDVTLYADAACQATLPDYTGSAVANDNCIPSASLTITQSPPSGFTVTADLVITMTVSGAIPNIDQSCTFNGVFVDTISPSIICPTPTNIYVDGSCQALMTDYTSSVVVADNCTGVPTVTQSPAPASLLSAAMDVNVTMTVTDGAGNTATCMFVQPVIDTISPAITCPGTQTENADINCFALLGDYTSLAATSDNCSATFALTQSPLAGTSISSTTLVTLSLTDESGNTSTCAFDVDLVDLIDPTVICPSTTTVPADAGCNYTLQDFTGAVTGADNCTAAINLTYAQSPASGTILPQGTQSITINVFDAAGNSGSCIFDVDVVDQTNPTVACPPNQSIIGDASCQGILGDYTGLAVPADNCSTVGNIVVQQSPASGAVISTDTPITITVTDEASNMSSCVFNAIFLDTISPLVTCPSDQTLAINTSCEYTVPDLAGSVTGTDNCSTLGNMTINQNPAAGTTQNGTTAVIITLIDEQGNSTTCITNLLPDDIDAPTITCPTVSPANNGTSCDFTLLNYGTLASVLDNCSNYSITQTPPAGTIVNPGMTDITLIVTDAGGNTDQCTFTLTVFETEAPTIVCPADISTCDPFVTYIDPVFSDNCAVSMSQTDLSGLSSGMTFPIGITTLEYTAIDSSGNTQVCTFDVEILDFPSPANIVDDTVWLCDQNSMVIDADPITGGTGLWTVLSGQGTFNNQFANSTGVNNLGIGISVFEWEVSSALCGTLSDTLVVVNSQIDLPASTQDTVINCANSIVLLEANTPLYGNGTWTTNLGAAISDSSLSNTTATLYTAGWQEFVWTITNGNCPATSDTVFVLANLVPEIYTADTTLCLEDGTLDISAAVPATGQTSEWSVVSGSSIVTPYNSPLATASNLNLGVNILVYSASFPGCQTVQNTLTIVGQLCDGFDPILPTVITPNFDGKNDLFIIDYLEQLYPECHVTIFNRWGSVIFESTGYSSPWDGTNKGEELPMGTYFYRIELNDDQGTILKGDISIIH